MIDYWSLCCIRIQAYVTTSCTVAPALEKLRNLLCHNVPNATVSLRERDRERIERYNELEDSPLRARSRAVSLPMPLLAPVISTVLSCSVAPQDQGRKRFLGGGGVCCNRFNGCVINSGCDGDTNVTVFWTRIQIIRTEYRNVCSLIPNKYSNLTWHHSITVVKHLSGWVQLRCPIVCVSRRSLSLSFCILSERYSRRDARDSIDARRASPGGLRKRVLLRLLLLCRFPTNTLLWHQRHLLSRHGEK